MGLTAVLVSLLIFWPQKGVVWHWRHNRQLSQRVLMEDSLKVIHKANMNGRSPTLAEISGQLNITQNSTATLLTDMQAENLLTMANGKIQLTPTGRDAALHIIRAHRLWERHLADETGYQEAEWHGQAERAEHLLTPEELDSLAQRLHNPTHDPHGDPIPTASGNIITHGGHPLTSLSVDTMGRIVHLEDEPEVVYAQLVAEGLHPGMQVRLIESTPTRIRFWANGDEHMLAPMIAANISVIETDVVEEPLPDDCVSLNCLAAGETAVVTAISPKLHGAERRRLMDLGILRGTEIKAEFRSPSGSPTAYQVRGALIALRDEQADWIKVTPMNKQSANGETHE